MKSPADFSAAALRIVPAMLGLASACALCQCSSHRAATGAQVVVSVKEQKLAVYNSNGRRDRKYPVSTSKYGINDKPGTYGTPVGMHEVVAKIGHGAMVGAVFKNRRPTGEVIEPGTPGRDPIVSRIMWLRGMEPQNKNAYQRCIYIHGTADEAGVGQAVSYGCIRMKSRDVVDLFNILPIGAHVYITESALPSSVTPEPAPSEAPAPPPQQQPPLPLTPEGARSSPAPATVAQNDPPPSSRPKPNPPPAQRRQESAVPQRRRSQDGSSIIYSAPSSSGGPGLTLRTTKRRATQSLSD